MRFRVLLLAFALMLATLSVSSAADCTETRCIYIPYVANGASVTPAPTSAPTATTQPTSGPSPTATTQPTSGPSPTATTQPTSGPSPTPTVVQSSNCASSTSTPTTPPTSGSLAWTQAARMRYSNQEAQGVVVGNKWYVFGGFDSRSQTGFTPTDRACVYDPATNAWTPIAKLPYVAGNGEVGGGMTHAPVATDGTYIYMVGGYIGQRPGYRQVFGTKQGFRYNVARDTYDPLPDLPTDRAAGQLVVLGRNLHYIGGTNLARTEDVNDHYVLSLDNIAAGWDTLADLPEPRQHAAAVALNGFIYYMGGQTGHDDKLTPKAAVHRYDPASNSWTKLNNMPKPINHVSSAAVVYNGKIITIGGQTTHQNGIDNVYAYDPAADSWTEIGKLPINSSNGSPKKVHSGVGAVLNGELYFATGATASPCPNDPYPCVGGSATIKAPLAGVAGLAQPDVAPGFWQRLFTLNW
jgi:N-acetylneuraminic acid mutarotase